MQEEVNQKVISLSIQGVKITADPGTFHLNSGAQLIAKSSPSEVPGNGQPQETESNAGENGRKDRTG